MTRSQMDKAVAEVREKGLAGAVEKPIPGVTLSHAEALRLSMLRMIDHSKPEWAQPSFWAPFVIVGKLKNRNFP